MQLGQSFAELVGLGVDRHYLWAEGSEVASHLPAHPADSPGGPDTPRGGTAGGRIAIGYRSGLA